MKELVCIVCPMGCNLNITENEDGFIVKGNTCKRGEKYGIQEMTNPKRMITTTVKLKNSYLQLLPVKTEDSIPKEMIFNIMKELDKVSVSAPINSGDIIVKNILNTGINIISTKTIEAISK